MGWAGRDAEQAEQAQADDMARWHIDLAHAGRADGEHSWLEQVNYQARRCKSQKTVVNDWPIVNQVNMSIQSAHLDNGTR